MAHPGEPLSPELLQQISACRAQFERDWISGRSPILEDGLDKMPPVAHPHCLRALLAVEIVHRRDASGAPLTDEQIIGAHPKLASDLKQALEELRGQATTRGDGEALTRPVKLAAADQTIATPVIDKLSEDEKYKTRDQGFHIRCPHCCNPVELVDDSSYESINCGSCGSVFSLVDRKEVPNVAQTLKAIGRFELMDCLGSGAFGTVWKARDPELHRIVALKVPRGGRLTGAEGEFFFREARAAAQLRHPNIVPVHEVGRDANTLFIVSDFVQGITLLDWLKGRRPTPLAIAELCAVVADGLHHAHEKGIIHRDLKPANILIDQDDQPHIMDFGLAKREMGEVTMTVDGQILGTPAYMSPEQAGGEGHWTDRRSDIYSLGIIAFEMLTGELPFRGNYQMQIQQRLTEDPPDPRKLNRNISGDLATICIKCMDRNPNRRYSTSADVAAEFRRFMNGEPIHARPLSAPVRLARWASRKPLVATVAALTIFLAIAGPTAAFFFERQRSRLAALVSEKNNLIDQSGIEKQQDVAKIADLSSQLALWEGKANPSDFWPPKKDAATRKRVASEFLNHAASSLGVPTVTAKSSGEDAALTELGLALMADEVGQKSAAIGHFGRARDELQTLSDSDPQRTDLARALAQCETALARLSDESDHATATAHFEAARAIFRRLAKEHPKTASYQIEWLESELNCAAMAGFDKSIAELKQVASINQLLPTQWPTTPSGVYRLACLLAEREPTLTPSDDKDKAAQP